MAKKKKTKKKASRRKGMGSLSGSDKVKRTLRLLTGVVSANLAHEGLMWLSEQPFMAQKVEEGKEPSKFNFKQVGADGGLLLGASIGAVLIKNEYAAAACEGLAISASMFLKEDLVKPALGMGAVEDFLELYKTNGTMKGAKPVQLAAPAEPIRL